MNYYNFYGVTLVTATVPDMNTTRALTDGIQLWDP